MPNTSERLMQQDNGIRDALEAFMQKGIDEKLLESLRKEADNLAYQFRDNIEAWLKDELAQVLSGYAEDMAKDAVKAMLDGNEELFRRYLSCNPYSYTARGKEHHVIHGKLFEAQCTELRRKLAQTYADLIQNERILDLEDQVRGLVEQVNEKDAEIERMREYYR